MSTDTIIRRPHWTYPVKGGVALTSTLPEITDANIDRAHCVVTCVLTTPAVDRQGEILDPMGGDYASYSANPVVFFDHRLNNAYPLPIAMAQEGHDAPLAVFQSETNVIAKHYFIQNDPMSMQLFRLIDDKILRGISVGFNGVPAHMEPIGMRPDGRGKAFRYHRWIDLEHSHTPLGVNGEALTIAVQKGYVGSERMLPMIMKSFTDHALPTPIQANGWTPEIKSMPDEKDDVKINRDEAALNDKKTTPEPSPNPESHADKSVEPSKPMKPSPGMLMGGAQCCRDAVKHLSRLQEPAEHKESLEAMEHVKAMMGEAAEHLEGALATHHPEVKYERPEEDHPENDDKMQPKRSEEGVDTPDDQGDYKVKSHKWTAPRFGPLGSPTIALHQPTMSAEDEAATRKELLKIKYEIEAAKRRNAARA